MTKFVKRNKFWLLKETTVLVIEDPIY